MAAGSIWKREHCRDTLVCFSHCIIELMSKLTVCDPLVTRFWGHAEDCARNSTPWQEKRTGRIAEEMRAEVIRDQAQREPDAIRHWQERNSMEGTI